MGYTNRIFEKNGFKSCIINLNGIKMKNFRIIELEKLNDSSNYERIEEGIYND